ncbi:Gamma-glutamyl-gamma-aminobutyrate hydrolase [uncultured Gammaproteobacteria bacterium]
MIQTPLVGVTANTRIIAELPYHVAGDKYVRAVFDGFGGIPLVIPALGPELDLTDLIARLDGLLVTGSSSNIEPHLYLGAPSLPGTLHDPERDATTLPLIRAALAAGLPLLGICRGLQELNVALGGTLHQQVHELPGKNDHRSIDDDPLDTQYGPAHEVELTAGGRLAAITGKRRLTVNSLHGQGIDRLAERLVVEAVAADGIVEAVRVADASGFTLGVQWHPEWQFWTNPDSQAILAAFGAAARERATLSPAR